MDDLPYIPYFPDYLSAELVKESYAQIEDAPSERLIGSAYAPKIFNRTTVLGLLALAVTGTVGIWGSEDLGISHEASGIGIVEMGKRTDDLLVFVSSCFDLGG